MRTTHKKEGVGRQWPILLLAVFSLILSGVVCAAGLVKDRSEREPGDRDRGDGFVRRHPPKGQEVEPGDAIGNGDFTHTGPLDKEVEPEDGGDARSSDHRTVRPRSGVPNTIQEPLLPRNRQ